MSSTYRLIPGSGGAALLIPPGVIHPELVSFSFKATIPLHPCTSLFQGPITVQQRRKQYQLTVQRNELEKQTGDWLNQWAAKLEAQGCVAPGDGWRLSQRIVESVPLDLRASFRLLYGEAIDVVPPLRIQVDSPILRSGTTLEMATTTATSVSGGLQLEVRSSDNLLGYERAWFDVREKPGTDGANVLPLQAERHVDGAVQTTPTPQKNYLLFPAEAGYYRLIYKQEQTEFTALIIGGRTRAELSKNVGQLALGSRNCASVEAGYCAAIPKGVAANLFLPVSVNGREELIHWGGTVRDAILTQDRQAIALIPRLSISKLHGGKATTVEFDREGQEILNLRLTGGETVNWR